MVFDRGNIKWVSLMLPEHVKMLKDMWAETEKIEKPEIDEQQFKEFDDKICEAMGFHWPLQFSFYRQGHIQKISGYVHYYQETQRKLHIEALEGEKVTLHLHDITDVEIID